MTKIEQLLSKIILLLGGVLVLSACTSIPKNASPVEGFEVARYMGTWYEIARFDFRFERNMNNTSAQYTLDEKGRVRVLNSGYNYVEKEWKKAEGKAKFRGDPSVAALKVSFFGPFYTGYNVVALDDNYQYALVAGKDLGYLWILSREKTMPNSVKEAYVQIAQEIGYDTSKLIWVEHDKTDNPYLNE